MTIDAITQASARLLAIVGSSAARALIVGACAGLALIAFRAKAASTRLSAWTVVLYLALAMPFLAWMLPPVVIPAPGFLGVSTVQKVAPDIPVLNVGEIAPAATATSKSSKEVRAAAVVPPTVVRPKSAMRAIVPWTVVMAGIYFVIAFLLLARLIVGVLLTRRLVRSSLHIDDLRLTQRLAAHSRAGRLTRVPRAAESEIVSVPVTVGILRPAIILPVGWRKWDEAQLEAVIAHEISHIGRRDAFTQCLSLFHRAIFWFSPLAWWLDMHLAELAEQASDEAALRGGADCNDYARTLLTFFDALRTTPGRVWWQGMAMANSGRAEERVERILAWKQAGGAISMGVKKSAVIMIVALAVPVVYLTASAHPANSRQSASQGSQNGGVLAPANVQLGAPAAPALAPAAPAISEAPDAGIYSSGPTTASPAGPTAPVAPPALSSAPSAWSGQTSSSTYSSGDGFSYAYGDDDDLRFVIVTGNSSSMTMSGSTSDARHAERLKKQIPGDFIWFQLDEKSYIIRDQAMIDRARQFWLPEQELGKKQEALGKQQAALGKQQEALGKKQSEVQVRIPDMSAQLDKLKAELQQLGPGATQDQLGHIQSEIGELQSRMGELQSQAGAQQSKLGEQQSVLGAQQGKLGEQQGELGRQQSELAREAQRKMRQLLDEAIKNGTAKPEAETGAML